MSRIDARCGPKSDLEVSISPQKALRKTSCELPMSPVRFLCTEARLPQEPNEIKSFQLQAGTGQGSQSGRLKERGRHCCPGFLKVDAPGSVSDPVGSRSPRRYGRIGMRVGKNIHERMIGQIMVGPLMHQGGSVSGGFSSLSLGIHYVSACTPSVTVTAVLAWPELFLRMHPAQDMLSYMDPYVNVSVGNKTETTGVVCSLAASAFSRKEFLLIHYQHRLVELQKLLADGEHTPSSLLPLRRVTRPWKKCAISRCILHGSPGSTEAEPDEAKAAPQAPEQWAEGPDPAPLSKLRPQKRFPVSHLEVRARLPQPWILLDEDRPAQSTAKPSTECPRIASEPTHAK